DFVPVYRRNTDRISIHALHTECDSVYLPVYIEVILFQSTHSIRSATKKSYSSTQSRWIFQSTHSIRSATFQPARKDSGWRFQSTHSIRSATIMPTIFLIRFGISIHALHTECDKPERSSNRV